MSRTVSSISVVTVRGENGAADCFAGHFNGMWQLDDGGKYGARYSVKTRRGLHFVVEKWKRGTLHERKDSWRAPLLIGI